MGNFSSPRVEVFWAIFSDGLRFFGLFSAVDDDVFLAIFSCR